MRRGRLNGVSVLPDCAPSFGAATNMTGPSPCCGILVVTVIQFTLLDATHRHRSCVAEPQLVGTDCWSTSNGHTGLP
jgi:hypothetical protein